VHLAWIGHPLVGDPLFEKSPTTRTGLHAWRLGFDAPSGRVAVDAPPDDEFLGLAGVDPAVVT
jgi:tRNA pseudouridine32 synthase/23S rRNA pseudouridine746 synthase/23S rRNA pseudouridine1911/1915/1917 synthase